MSSSKNIDILNDRKIPCFVSCRMIWLYPKPYLVALKSDLNTERRNTKGSKSLI